MQDSKGYLERMERSMREKLFFIKHIDLDNKIVIDFGSANGALVKELMKMGFENTTYFCVENNEEFFKECEKLKDTGVLTVSGLTEVEMWLRHNKQYGQDDREVVLICSSVMHELTPKMQRSVVGFSRAYCDYMIVRDMFYEYDSTPDGREKDILEKIICLSPNSACLDETSFNFAENVSAVTPNSANIFVISDSDISNTTLTSL